MGALPSKANLLVVEGHERMGSFYEHAELMAEIKSQQRPREGETARCLYWE